MAQKISGINCSLNFTMSTEELAQLLDRTEVQVVELWNSGQLQDVLDDYGTTEVLDAVGDGLYDFDGVQVGDGTY